MYLSYQISTNDSYTTIKEVIKGYFQVSDRLFLKLKQQNKLFLNHQLALPHTPVISGDVVSFLLDFIEDNENIVPTPIELSIIYEDEYYLVINKPAGIAVHPSHLHYNNSLSNGVRFYFDQIPLNKKIRIVNRLDRNTSGLVIFAKNEYIQECLIKQMQQKTFQKEYLAIVHGTLDSIQGTIEAPIARKENSIIERCVSPSGKNAITHYHVLEKGNSLSLIKLHLETGRTHQIRVHCKYIGHPILGDSLYGCESTLIGRQALHSYHVSFIHPVFHHLVSYTAPLSKDMKQIHL